MSASLDTVVTNIQNLANAVFTASTNFVNVNGLQDFFNVTAATVVRTGAGRICRVSVVVAGSAAGSVYDANSTTDTSRKIAVIPNTAGVIDVSLPVQYGVMIVPGTGMTVAGSFS